MSAIKLDGLTLASTANSTVNLDSSVNIKPLLNASGSAPVYACRAWVNFNGTGTVAIRASGNVSSITDNGTGDYTVNFSTAMPDANYCGVASAGFRDNVAGRDTEISGAPVSTAPTTSAFEVRSASSAGGDADAAYINVAIFR